MDRRQFHGTALSWLGASCMGLPTLRRNVPRARGERLLADFEALDRFGGTGDGGVERLGFSDADRAARDWVRRRMQECGLATRIDAGGNLIGRLDGRQDRPPLVTGSHLDSVPRGGRYDGNLGVLAGIEAVRVLRDSGQSLRHPLEVVVFANEENGKTGSKAWIGAIDADELQRETHSGFRVAEGLRRIGGDPDRLARARREPGDLSAFLELHIEQGGVLESREASIGLVQGIVGIRRFRASFDGFANHAGTTPMDERRDALVSAAHLVLAVEEIARSTPGSQVATVGEIAAQPGAANVIPGRTELSVEVRDLAAARIEEIAGRIRARGEEIARQRETPFDWREYYRSEGAPTDPRLQRILGEASDAAGHRSHELPSGAGHDAQSVARLAPVGMLFVPSIGGISHSPRERTEPADLVRGSEVLLAGLMRADDEDWS